MENFKIGLIGSRRRRQLQRKLLHWYEINRRDLPWRRTRDPYHIWISEIMLQQTRVAAVIPHYERFLRRFPTVDKLARAQESSVLAAWSGLGYYRRARLMHATSKKIVKLHSGRFLSSRNELATLPGIGDYTSAAIASIAFNEPVAAVDGNVRRVMERLVGRILQGRDLWNVAQQCLSNEHPGEYNQALMELGATVCHSRRPDCLLCPVTQQCASRGSLPRIETRYRRQKKSICYVLDRKGDSVFMTKRPVDSPLMPGMWEFPQIPKVGAAAASCLRPRHSITTTDYEVLVIRSTRPSNISGRWVNTEKIASLPLTGLARKILRAAASSNS